MRVIRPHCLLAAALLVSLSVIKVPPALAQAPAIPNWKTLELAVGKENYAEAKRLANAIFRQGTPPDRQKAATVYGRILLAFGQKDEARQYLAVLTKPGNDTSGGQLTAVYAAWFKALDGKPDEAIRTLEKMLDESAPGIATAEAADVLAMLYLARGEKEKAQKAVRFGLKCVEYQTLKDSSVKGCSTETLLRGRLTSSLGQGDAKRLYDNAEKLRAQGKFVEAASRFIQLLAMYPKSPWAHASGFRIGQCYADGGNLAQAADHWRKFIKDAPAGPWRGQTLVAMVDLVLKSELDFKKATQYTMAAATILDDMNKAADPSGPPGKAAPEASAISDDNNDAESSWNEAAYDIRLRQGILWLVEGRFEEALQAFQQAKQAFPHGAARATRVGLDRLLNAAKNQVRLIPEGLTSGDPRATVALSLGSVYKTLHQYDLAGHYFSLPVSGPLRSRSAPHRSFAGLGLARILVATGGKLPSQNQPQNTQASKKPGAKPTAPPAPASPLLPAAAAYEASLKDYPDGSWHEETLRELALLTERIAAESPVESSASKLPKEANKKKAAVSEALRQKQKKAILAARLKALPFWRDLRLRYPASRYVPEALYHVGVLQTEAEKPQEALAAFSELAQRYPTSPWTGEAQVRLIDVKLERQFDLPGARMLAEAAIDWYEHLDQKAAQAGEPAEDQSARLRSLKEVGYDIYMRAGLVEYLSLEQPAGTETSSPSTAKPDVSDPRLASPAERISTAALAFFEKAQRLSPERNVVVVHGSIPTGIERLAEAAKAGKSLTPDVVCQGDEKGRLILMLADAYHAGEQWQQSLDLCNRILDGAVPKATREQVSYAHFKRARNYFSFDGDAFNPEEALRDYVTAVRLAPQAPWASKAMFLGANILWNQYHNPDAAIAVWTRVMREYPDSIDAHSSTLFTSVVYRWTNRPDDAKKVLKDFLAKHPRSPVAQGARDQLAQLRSPAEEDDEMVEQEDDLIEAVERSPEKPSRTMK